jgi:hypothetical protein
MLPVSKRLLQKSCIWAGTTRVVQLEHSLLQKSCINENATSLEKTLWKRLTASLILCFDGCVPEVTRPARSAPDYKQAYGTAASQARQPYDFIRVRCFTDRKRFKRNRTIRSKPKPARLPNRLNRLTWRNRTNGWRVKKMEPARQG